MAGSSITVSLVLPADLHRRLKTATKASGRSIESELIFRVETTFSAPYLPMRSGGRASTRFAGKPKIAQPAAIKKAAKRAAKKSAARKS